MRKKSTLYDFADFVWCCEEATKRSKVLHLTSKNQFAINNNIKQRSASKNTKDFLPFFKDIVQVEFVRGSWEMK